MSNTAAPAHKGSLIKAIKLCAARLQCKGQQTRGYTAAPAYKDSLAEGRRCMRCGGGGRTCS
eukprot:1158023-Pelagomonas_calceolata.AAC.2